MISLGGIGLHRKRSFSLLMLLTFIITVFTGFGSLWAQEKSVSIQVNGHNVSFDVPPYIDGNGRTMVPLRFVLEELGSTVYWNGDNQEITVIQGPRTIKLWINQITATIDNTQAQLESAPVLKDGRTIVPLRFISENLGYKVSWDAQQYLVSIELNIPEEINSRQIAIITPQNPDSLVNVRSGPGTTFNTIDRVSSGTSLDITGGSQGWYQVLLPNGQKGWISEGLVTVRTTQQVSSRDDNTPRDRDPAPPGSSPQPENPFPPGKNGITGISVNEINGQQVVTIEGTSSITYNVLRLFNDTPRKLVVDIDNAVLADFLIKDNIIEVNKGPLIQVRLGQFTPETVRIVLDLSEIVTHSTQTAQDGKILSFNLVEPSKALSGKTIVIDPGHGAVQPGGWLDPGAVGLTGLHERVAALDIAQRLAKILEDQGARVILTHQGSTTLTLAGRSEVATDNGADIFVSIHANANVNRNISGTMTFYHNSGPNAPSSRLLALAVQTELVKKNQRRDIGIDTANFSVLRSSTVPSILVETAFISNHEEERLLADPNFRHENAIGIANGIVRYFNNL
jgi:N-acetylmuramoyl-L-alanine amidase